MSKIKCTECKYCKMTWRSSGWNGRGHFYCENPAASKLSDEVFGNKAPQFICFGTVEYETKPQIKTRPRWCPMEEEKK